FRASGKSASTRIGTLASLTSYLRLPSKRSAPCGRGRATNGQGAAVSGDARDRPEGIHSRQNRADGAGALPAGGAGVDSSYARKSVVFVPPDRVKRINLGCSWLDASIIA